MPNTEDVDSIIAKMSLPGRAQTAQANAPVTGGFVPPPGMGEQDEVVGGLAWQAPQPMPAARQAQEAEPMVERAPLNLQPKKPLGPKRKEDSVLQKHQRPVTCVTLDPSGKVLFTCGKDKLVMAWNMPDGEYLRTYEGHRGAVWACSVSPDCLLLLSCGADNMVLMWNVASAQQLTELQLPGVARCVEWSPGLDATGIRRCVTCSNSFKDRPAAVTLLEFGAGSEAGGVPPRSRLTIEEPALPSSATQVAWAGPHASCIASVHIGGEVLFWHAGTGALLTKLEAHEGAVSMVAFSRDRCVMASCGRTDMQVRVWDLSSGLALGKPRLLQSCLCDRPLNAIALRPSICLQDFTAARVGALHPQCDCLVGGGQDARDVALVGAGTDDQFDPLPLRLGGPDNCLTEYFVYGSDEPKGHKGGGHFGPIHALAFTQDSGLCVSGSEDGNVRLRELFVPGVSDQEAAHPLVGAPPLASKVMDTQQALETLPERVAEEISVSRFVAMVAFDPSVLGWPLDAPVRPLPLQRGQEVELVQDLGNGWARGRYVGNAASDFVGLFPADYVASLAEYHEMMIEAQERLAAMPVKPSGPEKIGEAGAQPGAAKEEDGDCSQS